jgi:molybdate/tungstate transport system ATP-binding protein
MSHVISPFENFFFTKKEGSMIKIESLRIELSGFVLQDIDLSIQNGEFFTLLGPTGAGKTLILEAIAGVAPITNGRIWVNGRDITYFPPEKRGIGIVYQDYALFPHLSVLENITYGLRYQKANSQGSKKRVSALIEQLGLQMLTQRSIQYLSGGERQRVSVARALAVNPSVLLLDEPLSALDPNFREDIRDVLKKLHQEVKITFLMVTHDFADTLFLGQRMAILNRGNIEQVGRVSDVFERPSTPFVAEFLGMKNVFPATFEGTMAIVDDLGLRLETSPGSHESCVAIRSEDIVIRKDKISENGTNVFKGEIADIIDRGLFHEVSVNTGKVVFRSTLSKRDLFFLNLSEKKDVYMEIRSSDIHAF